MAIAFLAAPASAARSHSTFSTRPLRLLPSPMPETLRRRRAPLPAVPNRASRRINVISKAALDKSSEEPPSALSGTRGALAGIALHLATATVFLRIVEGWPLLDALYFSVVVATTVGYGDLCPTQPASKVFVALYAIVSVALIGGLLQGLVERVADAQRSLAAGAAGSLIRSSRGGAGDVPERDMLQAARHAVTKARLKFRGSITMLIGACVSGAVLYGWFLQVSLVDLIYFLCVSITTVGLGDIHPVSRIGKAYAAIWLVLTSLGFASILSQYADLRLKERERDLAEKILSEELSERMFSEIDGDHDGTLTEAEFLGFMICKLGKVSPDEVSGARTAVFLDANTHPTEFPLRFL